MTISIINGRHTVYIMLAIEKWKMTQTWTSILSINELENTIVSMFEVLFFIDSLSVVTFFSIYVWKKFLLSRKFESVFENIFSFNLEWIHSVDKLTPFGSGYRLVQNFNRSYFKIGSRYWDGVILFIELKFAKIQSEIILLRLTTYLYATSYT